MADIDLYTLTLENDENLYKFRDDRADDLVAAGIDVDEHTVYLDGDDIAGLDGKVDKSSVGVANGVASLDQNGKVPITQIPLHQYSTVEKQIGIYIDGTTPVYEKTISTTINAVSNWTLLDDSVAYNYLLEAKGYLIPTLYSNEVHPFTSTMFSEPRFYVNLNDHKIYYYTTNDRYGQICVTLIYTKYTNS